VINAKIKATHCKIACSSFVDSPPPGACQLDLSVRVYVCMYVCMYVHIMRRFVISVKNDNCTERLLLVRDACYSSRKKRVVRRIGVCKFSSSSGSAGRQLSSRDFEKWKICENVTLVVPVIVSRARMFLLPSPSRLIHRMHRNEFQLSTAQRYIPRSLVYILPVPFVSRSGK